MSSAPSVRHPETVEDACSVAWAQFLRHQPDRDRDWRAWLFKTAQREAWALDRARGEMKSLTQESKEGRWWITEPLDPHDAFRERDELEAVVEVLEQLPPRLRRIAFLRATGHRYREISEITGDSRTRVSSLVRRANDYIREALQEINSAEVATPPRAERLHELEASPPDWLLHEIGRPHEVEAGAKALPRDSSTGAARLVHRGIPDADRLRFAGPCAWPQAARRNFRGGVRRRGARRRDREPRAAALSGARPLRGPIGAPASRPPDGIRPVETSDVPRRTRRARRPPPIPSPRAMARRPSRLRPGSALRRPALPLSPAGTPRRATPLSRSGRCRAMGTRDPRAAGSVAGSLINR